MGPVSITRYSGGSIWLLHGVMFVIYSVGANSLEEEAVHFSLGEILTTPSVVVILPENRCMANEDICHDCFLTRNVSHLDWSSPRLLTILGLAHPRLGIFVDLVATRIPSRSVSTRDAPIPKFWPMLIPILNCGSIPILPMPIMADIDTIIFE